MDELREHHDWSAYNAAEPATRTADDAQIWMISSQGDEKSIVLNSLREQALEGSDKRLGAFEWSAPDAATATDVEGVGSRQPEPWRAHQPRIIDGRRGPGGGGWRRAVGGLPNGVALPLRAPAESRDRC